MKKRNLLSVLQLMRDLDHEESMIFEHSGFINTQEKRELDSRRYDELMKKNRVKVKIREK